ncbi:hypothetical protein CTA2_7124 [Colletotrichum tanaceti]|uniref:Uncharacterized protein n=1 Tax=Colletotrichum tanaceti TaxID=1306861 RepID=A0A4U6X378_9PEZI|nr:hypothetical protein CTA2_7124 [Colletotrichum tanaceti]TKW49363.1 hypothetical protein CTA1_5847 [Colletotrichum tanaceti]
MNANLSGSREVGTGVRFPPVYPHPSYQRQAPIEPKQTPVPVPLPGSRNPAPPLVTSDLPQATAPAPPPANGQDQDRHRNQDQDTKPITDDYTKICAAIKDCDKETLRRAIRDNFEKCLVGSDYHLAFLMNVAMHGADKKIVRRNLRAFGSKIVSAGKHELIDWMTQNDVDEVADKIIAKASHTFLDKALVVRLRSIEAGRLVNALARAARLGYNADDIVENEHVIPSLQGIPSQQQQQQYHQQLQQQQAHTKLQMPPQQQYAAPSPGPVDPSSMRCQKCQHLFSEKAAFGYHIRKMICNKPPAAVGPGGTRYVCPHCVQTFSGLSGMQYHLLNKVCGDFGETSKVQIAAIPPQSNTMRPAASSLNPPTKRPAPDMTPTYISSNSSSPAPQHSSMAPGATPTPTQTQTPRTAPPGTQTPGSSQAKPLGMPDAKDMTHLTAQQIESLREELRVAEEHYSLKIRDTNRLGIELAEIHKRQTSLKNTYACRQSTIRKKYGIRLRNRRGREEMEHERVRLGIPKNLTPKTDRADMGTPSRDVHTAKRARIDDDGDAATTTTQDSRQDTPIETVGVTEMGNGLAGSNATAAMEDPTSRLSQAARPRSSQGEHSRPSSPYQQGNYRIEVHVPSPSKRPNVNPDSNATLDPNTNPAAAVVAAAPNGTPGGNTTPSGTSSGKSITAEQLLLQLRGTSGTAADEGDSSSDDTSTDEGE